MKISNSLTIIQTGRLLIIVIIFLSNHTFADSLKLSFSGYAMNIPAVERFDISTASLLRTGNKILLNISRVRIKPELRLCPNTRFAIAYEINLFARNNDLPFMPLSGKNFRQLVNLTWNPVNSGDIFLLHTIDRLYLKHQTETFEITIGRQRISWGTGRIWNPTDLFNPINPASFDVLEKLGADAVALKIYLGNFSDLSLVVQPQKTLQQTNSAVRIRSNTLGYDFSLLSGYFDKRVVAGADFAGSISGAGVRGEFLLSVKKDEPGSGFTKWIAGADYQFTRWLYALVEYHFNGEGTKDRAKYDLERLGRGEILNVNRSYLFTMLSLQVHPLAKAGLSVISNLLDKSGLYSLSLDISLKENLDITPGAQITYGDFMDEYRYYPSIYYLKAVYYF